MVSSSRTVRPCSPWGCRWLRLAFLNSCWSLHPFLKEKSFLHPLHHSMYCFLYYHRWHQSLLAPQLRTAGLDSEGQRQRSVPLRHTSRRRGHAHLCKQQRKRPTPLRRRLSRTHAVLCRVIPGGRMPISGMKVRSLIVFCSHSASFGDPPRVPHLTCCQMNWWIVVRRVQIGVPIALLLCIFHYDLAWSYAIVSFTSLRVLNRCCSVVLEVAQLWTSKRLRTSSVGFG